jgi:hypothetical protein
MERRCDCGPNDLDAGCVQGTRHVRKQVNDVYEQIGLRPRGRHGLVFIFIRIMIEGHHRDRTFSLASSGEDTAASCSAVTPPIQTLRPTTRLSALGESIVPRLLAGSRGASHNIASIATPAKNKSIPI